MVNSNTAAILVEGFHSEFFKIPRHMMPEFGGESLDTFGW
jgi:hypothetical protein